MGLSTATTTACVREALQGLRARFDLKYWPSLDSFLQELASDAENALPEAIDLLTAAVTEDSRASQADFFKALFAAIEGNCGSNYPACLRFSRASDKTLASLVKCSLDLSDHDMVDGSYVKRLRQRFAVLHEGSKGR